MTNKMIRNVETVTFTVYAIKQNNTHVLFLYKLELLGVFVCRFTAAIYGQGTKNQLLTDVACSFQ